MNYKNSVLRNNVLYVSGQLPVNPEGTIKNQIRETVEKILKIGNDNSMAISDLVNTTVYLTDIEDLSTLNEVYQEQGINEVTTRSTVEVNKLALNAKVEISAIFQSTGKEE